MDITRDSRRRECTDLIRMLPSLELEMYIEEKALTRSKVDHRSDDLMRTSTS